MRPAKKLLELIPFIKYTFLLFLLIAPAALYGQDEEPNEQPETEERVDVGVAFPFVLNKSTGSYFYNQHFLFEVLSVVGNNKINLTIINIESVEEELSYLESCKVEAIKTGYDYLLYSTVYSIGEHVFIDVKLINPYKNRMIFSNIYSNKIDYTMNESIARIAREIVRKLSQLELEKTTRKRAEVEEEEEEEETLPIVNEGVLWDYSTHYKHELYIMNGFFKNNPEVMSFLNWHMGYNFIPLEYIYFDARFFLGAGYLDDDFTLEAKSPSVFFTGGSIGASVFIKGIVEPNIGIRLELAYTSEKDMLQLSLPLDIGFKIYITNENVIRIGSSFPILNYDILNNTWKTKFTLGLLIGYGRKL